MGYPITYTKFFEDYTFPPIEAFDFLVIMGGPMSVNDIRDYPWLKEEIAFIKRAIDSDKIIIGICLGAQLIARALGAIVKKNDYKEIGWHRIYKTGTQTECQYLIAYLTVPMSSTGMERPLKYQKEQLISLF
jgi:GMP synthase-like glutamine amidotransferase